MKTIKATISGRVQRVMFRYNTFFRAKAWGLKGYVMNKQDGNVEAVFQGTEEKVNSILNWCKKGPLLAKVNSIKTTEIKNPKKYNKFEILIQ